MQEREVAPRLFLLERQQAGKPTQEEIDSVMRERIPQMQLEAVEGYLKSKESLADLSELKSKAEKDISQTALCATFVLTELGIAYSESARQRFAEKDMRHFRFNFDFAAGAKAVADRVIAAEKEMAGKPDEFRAVGGEANKYLDMRDEDHKSADLLQKDPTGFLLINDLISRVGQGTWPIAAFQAQEYFLAGAEIARDLYVRLYSTAVPLYPNTKV